MREQFRPIATNFTPVAVVGIPGLTLVIIAIALAVQFPEARWLLAAGLLGGCAIAGVLIVRRREPSADHDDRRPLGFMGRVYDDAHRLRSFESDRADRDRDPRRRPVPRRLVPVAGVGQA